jgi:hypothetical protein
MSVNIAKKNVTLMELTASHPDVAFTPTEMEIMDNCLTLSNPMWRADVDGCLACVFGLIPPTLMSDRAYLWLYTTDLVKDHTFLLVRHSQRIVEKMLDEYPTIVGHCHVRAKLSQRWIKWLGATFAEPQGDKLPFIIRKRELV